MAWERVNHAGRQATLMSPGRPWRPLLEQGHGARRRKVANAEVQERGGPVRYVGRSSRHRHFSDGLILSFEIELDLHIVGVTEKNLPIALGASIFCRAAGASDPQRSPSH
jgi:hypothetical protein